MQSLLPPVLLASLSRFHAERAIDIITHILPEDHLLLASSKRVKGTEIQKLSPPNVHFVVAVDIRALGCTGFPAENVLVKVVGWGLLSNQEGKGRF